MLALEVLVEAIDEIYDAERSLKPGDIPDRIIFKHIKRLWHLLLGIEETKFDSHNYELFNLVFENNGELFTAFSYFGRSLEYASKNLVNAVGSPVESTKIVKLLDEETGEDPDETSISFKLSILNRIRFIIFRHHMVVKEVMNESEVVKAVAKYMRNDILNTSNELSVSLKSNSDIFDVCYRECLESLLMDDTNLSIDEMAKSMIESFKIEADIAYFFNLNVLIRYHDQMIDLLKHIFRKHEFVESEINEFFIHNPIFPLLKPVYRKLALQNINSDMDTSQHEESATINVSTLNNKLMIEILSEISQRELEEELDEVPVTLKLFSQIVQYYCDSLKQEGINDIENDLYITLIKNVILQWVEGKTDQRNFINQLKDLSLIPTAMPYQYNNTTFPTVHMRMALYLIKENIRLIETYYNKWDKKRLKNVKLENVYVKWNRKISGEYLQRWENRINSIQKLEVINTQNINISNISVYFDEWRSKYKNIKNSLRRARIIQEKIFYDKWTSNMLGFHFQIKEAGDFYAHKLRIRYFTLWIYAKKTKFPEILEEFNNHKKKVYFNFWKNTMINLCCDYKIAADYSNRLLVKASYGKWSNKSKKPLLRLKKMDEDSTKFILKQQFDKWKLQMKFIFFESQLKKSFNQILLRQYFEKWYSFKQLIDSKNKIDNKIRIELTAKYFNNWAYLHNMLCKADTFYSMNKVRNMIKIWNLKTLEKSVHDKHDIIVIGRVIKLWKLKTTAKIYFNRKNYDLLHVAFINWFERATSTVERLEDCEIGVLQIKTAIYFDFWRKQCLVIEKSKYKADEFKRNNFLHNDFLTKSWSWKCWRNTVRESRRKRLEFKGVYEVFEKRIFRKYFDKWKNKKDKIDVFIIKANNFSNLIYASRCLNIWISKYDHLLMLQNLLFSRLDDANVHLLIKVISKMQLRMIKVQTDEANADRFKERWNRLTTKTFFDIWKLKQSKRTSPTPTARTIPNDINNTNMMLNTNLEQIPKLNPYVDLAPKDRGSPEYSRPPYQSHMTSVLTGKISEYEINQSFNDSTTKFGIETPITVRSRINSSYRTPMVKIKTNNFLPNSTRTSPNKVDMNLTPTERVRMRNVDERVKRYRLFKSPPKTGLDVLEESNQESNESGFNRSIFNSSNESLVPNSTPTKQRNGISY